MGAKFDKTFKISTTALYFNQSHPSLPFDMKWAMKIVLFYVFYWPVFASLLYSSIFHDSFVKICTNLSIALVFPINTFIYGIVFVNKKCFNDMIRTVEEDLELSITLDAEDALIVKKYTARGVWVSKFWLCVAVFCDSFFFATVVVGTLYSALMGNTTLIPMFELTYPTYIEDRKNESHVFVVILFAQFFYDMFSCLMYVGFNPLGPIFIMHACGQTELVVKQVKRLFVQEHDDKEETLKKLQDTVRQIQHIYSFIDKIQQAHKALFEMYLKSNAILIPIICFGVIESHNNGSISFELIGYVFACFMQCFIPCYYCEILMRKGDDLRAAIYECDWEKSWVPRSRPFILIMLTRTVRPICVRAVFCTVCLEAFSDVTNQAYRIFHVMNAAWNRG